MWAHKWPRRLHPETIELFSIFRFFGCGLVSISFTAPTNSTETQTEHFPMRNMPPTGDKGARKPWTLCSYPNERLMLRVRPRSRRLSRLLCHPFVVHGYIHLGATHRKLAITGIRASCEFTQLEEMSTIGKGIRIGTRKAVAREI